MLEVSEKQCMYKEREKEGKEKMLTMTNYTGAHCLTGHTQDTWFKIGCLNAASVISYFGPYHYETQFTDKKVTYLKTMILMSVL